MNYQYFKANIKALEALILTAPHLLSLILLMSKVYIKEKYPLYNTLYELSKVDGIPEGAKVLKKRNTNLGSI